jgi:hypothetical protein
MNKLVYLLRKNLLLYIQVYKSDQVTKRMLVLSQSFS